MKRMKKVLSILLCIALIGALFAGCSSKEEEGYSDTKLIIGYTDAVAPFIEVNENGDASGFIPELWAKLFDNVKGELTSYTFEKVEAGYELEKQGGFFNEDDDTEYSAGLLMGAVSKNDGTFNEDYSFTEPIISDKIIAVTNNDSKVKTFADFKDAKVCAVKGFANDAFQKHNAISGVAEVTVVDTIDSAINALNKGKADVIIVDELSFLPNEKSKEYTILENELDTIEYVIACAKYSGWKWSINEAIRELKSEKYGEGDELTPLVEKFFGYNASSFEYVTDGDK